MINVINTTIEGLKVIQNTKIEDHRGVFSRLFCEKEFSDILKGRRIVQINHSLTNKIGAVRGMHFQLPPNAEMKIIRCLRGRVLDIALDLRSDSLTFLKYHTEILSAENCKSLVIPEGFAHGFQVLEESSELMYFHTANYAKNSESGIRLTDPRISLKLPLDISEISERDLNHPLISCDWKGIKIEN